MDATLKEALATAMSGYSDEGWWSLSPKIRVAVIYQEMRRLDNTRVAEANNRRAPAAMCALAGIQEEIA
jgi:hypothetical protein